MRIFRALDRLAVRYHADFENQNYDIQSNGEQRVLELLRVIQPKCLLDVGANVGDWSVIANALYPSAIIHSFEIAPPTFLRLVRRVESATNILAHNFGLGAKTEEVDLNYSAEKDYVSSVFTFAFSFGETIINTQKLKSRIVKGDEFLDDNSISRVDLLKIDVEGMESDVLEGFHSHLSKGQIRCVQFEYGMFNIVTKFLLSDFYTLFRSLGYCVGKIYPNYVDFSEYDYTRENFIGGNYLAVHQDETHFISALKGFASVRC